MAGGGVGVNTISACVGMGEGCTDSSVGVGSAVAVTAGTIAGVLVVMARVGVVAIVGITATVGAALVVGVIGAGYWRPVVVGTAVRAGGYD